MGHSVIAPSSAHVWVYCSGSVTMALQFPARDNSDDAAEGNAAHELAERMIAAKARAGLSYPSRADVVGSHDSAGTLYTDELYDCSDLYATYCGSLMQSTGVFAFGQFMGCEDKVDCPDIHPLNGGTCDFWLFDSSTWTLHVVDFKGGRGIVEAFENWQMIDYANGLLRRLGIDGLTDQRVTVKFHLIQPRAYHPDGSIRTWECKASDLRAHFNKLHFQAHESLSADAKCIPGKHCKHCPARYGCGALREAVYDGGDYVRAPVPEQLPPHALGLELKTVRRIYELAKFRFDALETEAEARVRAGEAVSFVRMEQKRPSLKWDKGNTEVISFGQVVGVDLRKTDPITPTQARDVLKAKGVDPTVIDPLTVKVSGGYKLTEDNGNKAKEVFGQ